MKLQKKTETNDNQKIVRLIEQNGTVKLQKKTGDDKQKKVGDNRIERWSKTVEENRNTRQTKDGLDNCIN